jgi:hypothetical protein
LTTFTSEDLQSVLKGADDMSDKGYKETYLGDAIRFKMKRDKKRFWAGDNVSDYVTDEDKEKLKIANDNSENLKYFNSAFASYQKRYRKLFDLSPETKRERAGFLHFCGTHRLTLEGLIFIAKFKSKLLLRNIFSNPNL